MDPDFSPETIEWLGNWLSGGKELTSISEDIVNELKEYVPDEPVKLYRGVLGSDVFQDADHIEFKFLSSWTYDKNMALNFSDVVIEAMFEPSDIFVDITMLSPDFIINECSGFPDEMECIINPGIYKFDYVKKLYKMDPVIFDINDQDRSSEIEDVQQKMLKKIENDILKYNTYSIKNMLNNVNLELIEDDDFKAELISDVEMTGPVIANYEVTYKEFELIINHDYFEDLDLYSEDGGLRISIYYRGDIEDNMLQSISIFINQSPKISASFYHFETDSSFDIMFDITKDQGIKLALKMGVSKIIVGNETKSIQEAYDELGG